MESVHRKKFALIRIRTWVLCALLIIPLLVYAAVGTVAVWRMGWLPWLWWVIPVFWLGTWAIAWLWPAPLSREREPLGSDHWTPRDQAAAEIVQKFQTQVDQFAPTELTDPHLYLNQAQALAAELARHYHPHSTDPLTSLTMPEILAACRLVADDLEGLLLNSVPGSRLLTIGQWKQLGKAPKWIRQTTNAIWAASILINPLNIARYGTSRATADRVASGVQTELLMTMYLRFIRQVGFYLIEMNSGRLRGGADLYRATFDRNPDPTGERTPGEQEPGTQAVPRGVNIQPVVGNSAGELDMRVAKVNIAIVGQTSAGKSSLINSLIGRADAAVDILPTTDAIQKYQFQLDPQYGSFHLLDTPGYGQAGATANQQQQIESALHQADAMLLVMDAHSPAREADRVVLESVKRHYQQHPKLKPPPVLAVLTHVDLLPPVMEWNPPYDWQSGSSAKEKSIAGAIDYTRELLGVSIIDAVPVCTAADEDRQWGVVENLLPALSNQLGQARSVSLLAAFEKSLSRDRIKILLRQAKESGKQLLKNWLAERL